jgi:hypothetical protein
MVYLTKFRIRVESLRPGSVDLSLFEEKFNDITGYSIIDIHRYQGFDCKWYEWKRDMLKFSKFFPDYKFYLEGLGLDPGKFDEWGGYFHGGGCEITYRQPPAETQGIDYE